LRLHGGELAQALAGRIPPAIALFGAEPLAIEESADAVRAQLRARGYAERLRFTAEPGLDWGELAGRLRNASLFSERRLVEIRFPGGRPDERSAGPALAALIREPAADTVLLLIAGALDRRALNSDWFAQAGRAGWVVDHPAIGAEGLPSWIRERAARLERSVEPAAVETLCRLYEGNLLALEQELRKLALLTAGRAITAGDVEASASDNARYGVGALADACLTGAGAQALRVLGSLRAEGEEPILLLTVLTREVRQAARLAAARARGMSLRAAFGALGVWRAREGTFQKALTRHDGEFWNSVLRRLAHLDRVLKGRASGNIWHELEQVCAACGGADRAIQSFWTVKT
jgi:DNA polymerase-3 subunit delta